MMQMLFTNFCSVHLGSWILLCVFHHYYLVNFSVLVDWKEMYIMLMCSASAGHFCLMFCRESLFRFFFVFVVLLIMSLLTCGSTDLVRQPLPSQRVQGLNHSMGYLRVTAMWWYPSSGYLVCQSCDQNIIRVFAVQCSGKKTPNSRHSLTHSLEKSPATCMT